MKTCTHCKGTGKTKGLVTILGIPIVPHVIEEYICLLCKGTGQLLTIEDYYVTFSDGQPTK